MGNYQSCIISCPKPIKPASQSSTKLLDPQGNLCYIHLPAVAAELMVEFPGYVVSSAAELHRTGRIVGLRADDDLVAGNMYLMVPPSKINCKVTAEVMTVVEATAGTGKWKGDGQGKVSVFWEDNNLNNKTTSRRHWTQFLNNNIMDS